MKIVEKVDRGRFLVQSETRAGINHLVDVLAYRSDCDYNGSCTCESFQCNMEPKLKKGQPPSDALRCKHIRFVREGLKRFCLSFLLPIWEMEEDGLVDISKPVELNRVTNMFRKLCRAQFKNEKKIPS